MRRHALHLRRVVNAGKERGMEKDITRDELKEKMDRGDDFVLVDALSHQHYASRHLPGAINLP